VESVKKVTRLEAYRHGQVLQMFWQWSQDEDLVTGPLPKKGRRFVKGQQTTPLSNIVTPSQVLGWEMPPDLQLLSLLCYLLSLRPQEALAAKTFVAGSKASALECSRVMEGLGLSFNKLAVYVEFQKTGTGELHLPKANSKGWVSCFDERAVRLIIPLCRGP
jgi:hypothetical protein